eukprot:GFUD01020349.1.p1 GENE.GFUD01020349.1~~GFUD01020349.1.p1  ORF type:complete len:171 (-),score=29.68 GFUD01020349.1:66-578(-)
MYLLKLIQTVKVPCRSFHRPTPKKSYFSWFKIWWDKYYSPRQADGSFNHWKAHKIGIANALLCVWCYEFYSQRNKYLAGEETYADLYWVKHQIDLGFRVTTKDTDSEIINDNSARSVITRSMFANNENTGETSADIVTNKDTMGDSVIALVTVTNEEIIANKESETVDEM